VAEKYRTRRELTPELIDVFCKALELPATFSAAANVAGFSERTMRSWLSAGESEDCTDEVLQLLASKYAKVMSGGVRARLTRTAIDLAEGGNEKMLQFCLKADRAGDERQDRCDCNTRRPQDGSDQADHRAAADSQTGREHPRAGVGGLMAYVCKLRTPEWWMAEGRRITALRKKLTRATGRAKRSRKVLELVRAGELTEARHVYSRGASRAATMDFDALKSNPRAKLRKKFPVAP
jgi:hypothetical protein